MAYIEMDGIVVDDDSGEIIEAPTASDPLAVLAQRLYDANQQVKAWESYSNALKAVILRNQQQKSVVYGDVTASIRQATRATFDLEAWRESLCYDDLSSDQMAAIIDAATGFNVDTLPNDLDAARFVSAVAARPYVVVSLVRKPAPKMQEEARS